MATFFPEGPYRTTYASLADTNEAVIYTCPTAFSAFVAWLTAADDGGAARTITYGARDSSASTTYILTYQEAIAANTPLTKELYLVLEPGDTLRATGSAAGIHIAVTVMEHARRTA